MFNLNPKQMEHMMKKLGMQTQQIDAKRVTIECADKNIVIDNPQVTKIKFGVQETFQIIGEAHEQQPNDIAKQRPAVSEKFTHNDIELIIQQTGASEAEARSALEETQDIAQAILKLKK